MFFHTLVLLVGVSSFAIASELKDKFLSEYQVVVSHAAYKCRTSDGQLHAVKNLTECVFKDTTLLNNKSVSPEAVYFFHELLRKARNQEIRQKRQARFRRQEMRMLSLEEWNVFVRRLQVLKNSGRYDEIARFHGPGTLQAAHNGESFLGWHRIYLLWLEYYLGVPIPYWDSSLDFHMEDPSESIIWSDYYLGNGRDLVVSGPFAFWRATNDRNLLRNISGGGSLIARENIQSIMTRRSNRDLVHHDFSLEIYHNSVHVWVGGHMVNVEGAPSDPVFYLHHCFIDKLWADAQRNMINPEEYPYNGENPLHHPNNRMVAFPVNIPNIVGYRNWIGNLAAYAPSPSEGNCFSRRRDVRALEVDNQGRCISGRPPPTRGRMFASRFNADANLRGMSSYERAVEGMNQATFVADLEDRRVYSNPSSGVFERQFSAFNPAFNRFSPPSFHYNSLQAFVPKRRARRPLPMVFHPAMSHILG